MPLPLSTIATRAPMPSGLARAALGLSLTLAASSCGPELPEFAPACPVTGVLSDAADLTRFNGRGVDLTDLVIDGRVGPPRGQCKLDDLTHLHTTITVGLDLTRGPAATSRTIDVTYVVWVTKGETILDKKDYKLAVKFPPNSDHVSITGEPVNIVLPVDDKTSGVVYQIRDGFQLTPQELAFNRHRGVR